MVAAPDSSAAADLIRTTAGIRRPPLVAERTALLVIDMVNWQVPRAAAEGTPATPYFVNRLSDVVIPQQRRLLAAGRELGVKIVFLRVGAHLADYSDAVPALRSVFSAAEAREGLPACEVIPELAPLEGELSIIKTGSGGFTTSALDGYLGNMGVEAVLYTGVVTNACVLLTLAAGFDLGYSGYLVSDATATLSESLQQQTEEIAGSFMAEVVNAGEVIARLRHVG